MTAPQIVAEPAEGWPTTEAGWRALGESYGHELDEIMARWVQTRLLPFAQRLADLVADITRRMGRPPTWRAYKVSQELSGGAVNRDRLQDAVPA